MKTGLGGSVGFTTLTPVLCREVHSIIGRPKTSKLYGIPSGICLHFKKGLAGCLMYSPILSYSGLNTGRINLILGGGMKFPRGMWETAI